MQQAYKNKKFQKTKKPPLSRETRQRKTLWGRQQAWRKNFNQQRKESTNKQQLQKINGGTFASLKKQIANQKENSRGWSTSHKSKRCRDVLLKLNKPLGSFGFLILKVLNREQFNDVFRSVTNYQRLCAKHKYISTNKFKNLLTSQKW